MISCKLLNSTNLKNHKSQFYFIIILSFYYMFIIIFKQVEFTDAIDFSYNIGI